MSYVEKAFWDYLKSTLFGGIRILLSRRLILFSVILFATSITTTTAIFLQNENPELITEEVLKLIFSIQISIAIGFIVSGLVSKKLNTLIKFMLLLAVVVIIELFFFISNTVSSLEPLSDALIQIFPLLSFISWAFLVPLASFAFAKGLFSNKVTGSILFLGKPTTDKKSIFSGIMTIIAFISIIWNIYIIFLGSTASEPRLSYVIVGFLGVIVAFLIILIVQGWLFTDDVFNTALGFFFIMNIPNQIMIFLTSLSGSENIITSFDFIMVVFSLLYSAQNISRRVKMKGVVIEPGKKHKKSTKDDPFYIGRFIGFVGGEGIVLVFLGLVLGFHLVQLQILSGEAIAWETLFGSEIVFSEAYHDITMFFSVFIVVIVLVFYRLQGGKGYWKADIYRFDFLPPYEDLVNYIERIKKGEISKTDIAVTVGKKAVGVSGIGVFSAAKKFKDIVFRDKKENRKREE